MDLIQSLCIWIWPVISSASERKNSLQRDFLFLFFTSGTTCRTCDSFQGSIFCSQPGFTGTCILDSKEKNLKFTENMNEFRAGIEKTWNTRFTLCSEPLKTLLLSQLMLKFGTVGTVICISSREYPVKSRESRDFPVKKLKLSLTEAWLLCCYNTGDQENRVVYRPWVLSVLSKHNCNYHATELYHISWYIYMINII